MVWIQIRMYACTKAKCPSPPTAPDPIPPFHSPSSPCCPPSLRRCEVCRRQVSTIHILLTSSLPSFWQCHSIMSVNTSPLVTAVLHLQVLALPPFWVESRSLFPERKAAKIGSRLSLKRTTAERRTGLYKCSPSRKRISIKKKSEVCVLRFANDSNWW